MPIKISSFIHVLFFIALAGSMAQDGRDVTKVGLSWLAPDGGGSIHSSVINIESAVIFYRCPLWNEGVSYPDVVQSLWLSRGLQPYVSYWCSKKSVVRLLIPWIWKWWNCDLNQLFVATYHGSYGKLRQNFSTWYFFFSKKQSFSHWFVFLFSIPLISTQLGPHPLPILRIYFALHPLV